MTDPTIERVDEREIELTRLDRVLWPEEGITKGDLLTYYREIAPILLPHLRDRPVTLRVFPGGIGKNGHYRREMPSKAPEWLRHTPYKTATDGHAIELPLIDDASGLLWFANTGAIEFHHWLSREDALETPDLAVFDLDPGDEAAFTMVLNAALTLRSALTDLGLEGAPKTSGGRGLHVFLPLAPGHTYDGVREWVKALAAQLAIAHPDLIAVSKGATHAGNLITVDYAQNSLGRNTAAPYTVRAHAGAPVSTPLRWEEVEAKKIRPEQFTIATVPKRIEEHGDLFDMVLKKGQRLPSSIS